MKPIPLRDLDARFQRLDPDGRTLHRTTLADAQAIMFLCPTCFETNGGDVGTHSMLIGLAGRGFPETIAKSWTFTGTGLDDLTCTPSIQIIGGCKAHFFIRNGAVVGTAG